jgi:phage/plasmid-like protein (TIGR03299 family)
MAHMIDDTAGLNAIAYRGETPWHGLGQKMEENEPLEAWRIRAGLGWDAIKVPVRYQVANETGDGPVKVMHGKSVLYRSDTKAALSTVSDRYQVVQPAEVLEFYRDLTERHGFRMETAGAIKNGRVVWALAKTGDVMRISGNDVVEGYLLLSTSYDGSLATTGRFTTVRVVCNNTLTAAHGAAKAEVSVPHSTLFNMDAAKIKLGVGDSYKVFAEQAQAMAEKGASTRQAIDYFLAVYHDMTAEAIGNAQAQKTTDKTIARLAAYFTNGPGAELRSAKGTVWGLLNAVTFDVDHSAGARTDDSRLASAWYGAGDRLKNKARELALKLAA